MTSAEQLLVLLALKGIHQEMDVLFSNTVAAFDRLHDEMEAGNREMRQDLLNVTLPPPAPETPPRPRF